MTRRRRFLALAGVLLAGAPIAALARWLLTPGSLITRENRARLRPGMTRAEVESILGGPPRYEPRGPVTAWAPWGERPAAVPVSPGVSRASSWASRKGASSSPGLASTA